MYANVNFVGFSTVTRDGQVYSSETAMISDARKMMVAAGKVYSSVRNSNSAITGGKFARKAARKQARREQREIERAAAEIGIEL